MSEFKNEPAQVIEILARALAICDPRGRPTLLHALEMYTRANLLPHCAVCGADALEIAWDPNYRRGLNVICCAGGGDGHRPRDGAGR